MASLKLDAARAILALHCCGRRGLTQALGAEKHSAVLLLLLQFYRLRLQCSSECLSARCSSVAVLCALRLGLRDGAMACAVVRAVHFRPLGKCTGRARFLSLLFSAMAPECCCSRVPTRLTIRSSRRRFVASLKLAVRRAILAHNRRGRRGLTQALGGRKAFCNFAFQRGYILGFGCNALRFVGRRVVSFGGCAVRAHGLLA